MNEVRELIGRLIAAGIDPVEAAEIITRAAIAGVAESQRSAGAVRQERYRRNKASQTVTSDAAVPSPEEMSQTLKEEPPSDPSTHKENPLRGQKKGSRLPDDFVPDLEWATGQGLTPSQAQAEAAKFRDHFTAKSGRDATKRDWPATWRNWVRTALERLPRNRNGPPQAKPPSQADVFQFIARKAADDGQGPEDRDGVRTVAAYLPAVGSG